MPCTQQCATEFWTFFGQTKCQQLKCGRIPSYKVSTIIIGACGEIKNRHYPPSACSHKSFSCFFSSARRQMTCWWRLQSVRAMTRISTRVSRAQVGQVSHLFYSSFPLAKSVSHGLSPECLDSCTIIIRLFLKSLLSYITLSLQIYNTASGFSFLNKNVMLPESQGRKMTSDSVKNTPVNPSLCNCYNVL